MRIPQVKIVDNDGGHPDVLEQNLNAALRELNDQPHQTFHLIDIKLDTGHTYPEFAMIIYEMELIARSLADIEADARHKRPEDHIPYWDDEDE